MAHKITALFSSVQIFTLGRLSADLEQAARKGDYDQCRLVAKKIDKGLDKILKHIKEHQLLKKEFRNEV